MYAQRLLPARALRATRPRWIRDLQRSTSSDSSKNDADTATGFGSATIADNAATTKDPLDPYTSPWTTGSIPKSSAAPTAPSATPWTVKLQLDIQSSGSNVEVKQYDSRTGGGEASKAAKASSAVAAFGYNYIFYRNNQDQLTYAKWKDGKGASNLRVSWNDEFVTVGRGGIEAVTINAGQEGECIRVYLIKGSYLAEFCLDKNDDDAWYKGKLTTTSIQASETSVLSVVEKPLRVLFNAPGNQTLLSQAIYDKDGKWYPQLLESVDVPAN